MLKKKQAGIVVSRERAVPRPQNVLNIIDALRQSVAQEKAASASPKKPLKRINGQAEILLSIPGKKSKGTLQKPANQLNARSKNVG
jgi:DNA end-binding protein Ku